MNTDIIVSGPAWSEPSIIITNQCNECAMELTEYHDRNFHYSICCVCEEQTCGRCIEWDSKKFKKKMWICMDCVFEGALYFKGIMDFDRHTNNVSNQDH